MEYESVYIDLSVITTQFVYTALPVISLLVLHIGRITDKQPLKRYDKNTNADIHQQLLAAGLQGEEKERQRIARELHDGLAPMIASAKLRLSSLRSVFDKDDQQAAAFREITDILEISLQDIRRLSYNLNSSMLSRYGLTTALSQYCRRMQQLSDACLTCTVDEVTGLKPEVELALFRISQELLQNAIRHADAANISLSLIIGEEYLKLLVKDDGIGFDPEQIAVQSSGLHNVQERVGLLGGRMCMQSSKRKGTSIEVILRNGI
jgi:signal transduction histidine kinase